MSTVEIVVISLLSAEQRRRRISAMFEGSQLNWRYYDAHNSLQHSGLSYDAARVKKTFGRTLSVPEIAICSSHVAVLEQYVTTGVADYILVFEDDVIFDINFPIERFGDFCRQKKIQYMRLFAKHYVEGITLGYFYDRHIVRFKTSPTGAQAYLMSKSGAKSFLQSFTAIDQPLDLALDSFWRTGLPLYSIFPFPIIEGFSRSQNLIPPYTDARDLSDRITRFYTRAANKTKKAWANFELAARDRKMKRAGDAFQQIFDD